MELLSPQNLFHSFLLILNAYWSLWFSFLDNFDRFFYLLFFKLVLLFSLSLLRWFLFLFNLLHSLFILMRFLLELFLEFSLLGFDFFYFLYIIMGELWFKVLFITCGLRLSHFSNFKCFLLLNNSLQLFLNLLLLDQHITQFILILLPLILIPFPLNRQKTLHNNKIYLLLRNNNIPFPYIMLHHNGNPINQTPSNLRNKHKSIHS